MIQKKLYEQHIEEFWDKANSRTRTWIIFLVVILFVNDCLSISQDRKGENKLELDILYSYYLINSILVILLTILSFRKPLTKKEIKNLKMQQQM